MFCRIHKFIISSALDADKPLWSVTQRHLERCAECSRFHVLCRTMGRCLETDSSLIEGLVTEDLQERILDDVERTKNPRMPVSINFRPVLAVAACILLIAVPSAVLLLRPPRVSGPNQYERAVAVVRDIYESGTLLTGGLTRNKTRLSSFVENPLENEMHNLTADTESALRFVIANVAVRPPKTQLPN